MFSFDEPFLLRNNLTFFIAIFAAALGAESAAGQGLPSPFAMNDSAANGEVTSESGVVPPAVNRGGALAAAQKNLMEQRMHLAAYPEEAEVRCFLFISCDLGLTRGFVLGSDLGAVMGTPIFGPILRPGKWIVLDGYVGFQFLRSVDEKVYANAAIGYRTLEAEDSDERTASSRGFTFKINYGQEITTLYTQALSIDGFYAENTTNVDEEFFERGSDTQKFLEDFYSFSQGFPRIRVAMPADLEFINWKNTHIDLPNHLRGYGRIEPFYIQNEFRNDFPGENEYVLVERNFGLRLAYLMSYESVSDRSGRYAFLAGLGADVQTSDKSVDYEEIQEDYQVTLPKRPTLMPFFQLGASYQF